MKGYSSIDYNEQFKIRPRRNASAKHEVIKLLIVLKILEKFKHNLHWIRIYTEYVLGNKKVCDIYFENVKTNEIICYEIQSNISKKWLKETQEFYENFDRIYFKTDWILIKEKELSSDIETLENQVKELIA